MEVVVSLSENYTNVLKRDSITLTAADVKSLINGVVPSYIITSLQIVANRKVQHDLKLAEEANDIQKSNQSNTKTSCDINLEYPW